MGLMPFGGGCVPRRNHECYPTHPAAVVALMRAEAACLSPLAGPVWEPAAGPMMIARTLAAAGFDVVASDLHEYEPPARTQGWARDRAAFGVDFLSAAVPAGVRRVVTNPPYDAAAAWVRRGVEELRIPYVAMLLKATFWHAGSRRAGEGLPAAARIYPLGWRLDWKGRGSPPEEHAWMVWDASAPPLAGALYMANLARPESWPDTGYDDWMRGLRVV